MVRRMNLSDGNRRDANRLPGVVEPTRGQCEKLKSIIELGEECSYTLSVQNRFHGTRVVLEQCEVLDDAPYMGELSVDFVGGIRLIVERVALTKQRRGTFTDVMKYLYSIIAGTSIVIIEIQSVLTEEMVSWCQGHGFKPLDGQTLDECGRGGSYACDAQSNPLLE